MPNIQQQPKCIQCVLHLQLKETKSIPHWNFQKWCFRRRTKKMFFNVRFRYAKHTSSQKVHTRPKTMKKCTRDKSRAKAKKKHRKPLVRFPAVTVYMPLKIKRNVRTAGKAKLFDSISEMKLTFRVLLILFSLIFNFLLFPSLLFAHGNDFWKLSNKKQKLSFRLDQLSSFAIIDRLPTQEMS